MFRLYFYEAKVKSISPFTFRSRPFPQLDPPNMNEISAVVCRFAILDGVHFPVFALKKHEEKSWSVFPLWTKSEFAFS